MKKIILLSIAIIVGQTLFSQTRTELVPRDLPSAVNEYVKGKMHGFTISKSFKVDSKGIITYNVLVKKGDETQVLIFNKDGIFTRNGDKKEKDEMEKIKPKK